VSKRRETTCRRTRATPGAARCLDRHRSSGPAPDLLAPKPRKHFILKWKKTLLFV